MNLATITDEEMKTGDPQETLRRASMQPTQISEGLGITTRQQRKRVSLETHQGPGTPEVSDTQASVICSHHVLSSKWEGNLAMGLLERPLSDGEGNCLIVLCLTVQESYQLLPTAPDSQGPA